MTETPTIELVIKTAKEGHKKSDSAILRHAYKFAANAHKGQKRESGEPYIIHPLHTAMTLAEMHMDDASIAGALLHDVVDDTPVTTEEITKEFGEEIGFLVEGITKLGKIKYHGVERQVENLRKVFLSMAEDIRVVLIKLADRLHNMQSIEALKKDKRLRIARETLDIYAPLASRLGIGEIQAQLEDLSFPIVYEEDYKWILKNVREEYVVREKYAKRLIPIIEKVLKTNGIKSVTISARAKHYYSLWKKLKRYDMDLSKVHDLVALRIILPNVEDCYATLGILHKHWKPLPTRIKDYIAIPKPNGYCSLHTTVFCEESRVAEFQIRTQEMHEQAEHGIAAHWAYSEAGKRAINRPGHLEWVEQLRDWQQEVRGSDEFLDALRIDFFRDRIFVFTPRGDVIELPEDSTPIDFAYHIHSEIGDSAIGARVNGVFRGLDTRLENGDLVEMMMQKGKKPTVKLLEIARTSAAKSHIRKALRNQGIEPAPSNKSPIRAVIDLAVDGRVGMLKDVSSAVARRGISIHEINGKDQVMHLVVTLSARKELKEVLKRIQKVKGVASAKGRVI